ncbi:MAG TPA: glycoside hydrolase family 3 C-terminal domain-containing protein [Rhizomicrobium sp.]|jgi:beta-glucosidase
MKAGVFIQAAVAACLLAVSSAAAQEQPRPWMNTALSPDARADLLEKALTQDEKISVLHGSFAIPFLGAKVPDGALGSAGYVPGVPRLGVPALQETDASLGVANPFNIRPGDTATALPSGLALAATFNLGLAHDGGAMIGQEAWRKGFNVLLAGGTNLARDPRNGRNFEYLGEDPLLAGELAGASIRGIEEQHVVSTTKHFAVNDQETGRNWANAVIGEAAMRQSDLLAFELAIERGQPGSVMCSYNLVNGAYACGNNHLLNDVLKTDWKFPGWVMSDWGAVHSVDDAKNGLDQESGSSLDDEIYFDKPLTEAVNSGALPQARLSDMVRRIFRSMFAAGLFDHPPVKTAIDTKADSEVALHTAEQGIVLLKNGSDLLPLASTANRIAVIGGHADAGVLSGAGSSQVTPVGGPAAVVPVGGEGLLAPFRKMIYVPSSPLQAIRAAAPSAQVKFDDGRYVSSATALAKWADIVIVFANQWSIEDSDLPDLTLPDGQDALVAAITAANPKTIVVLQTAGPVSMPWLSQASAVVEAWYPGQRGGEAIANVLFGRVNPSGRLPLTFPRDIAQNPRPEMPGAGLPRKQQFDVNYTEGSKVGYRWFADRNLEPLFPFGFGLSYTSFDYAKLRVEGGKAMRVSFTVRNSGKVAGMAAPQLYLASAAGRAEVRLLGFDKIALDPGQSRRVTMNVDPRLLADFDEAAHGWRIRAGSYAVKAGDSSRDTALSGSANMDAAFLKP